MLRVCSLCFLPSLAAWAAVKTQQVGLAPERGRHRSTAFSSGRLGRAFGRPPVVGGRRATASHSQGHWYGMAGPVCWSIMRRYPCAGTLIGVRPPWRFTEAHCNQGGRRIACAASSFLYMVGLPPFQERHRRRNTHVRYSVCCRPRPSVRSCRICRPSGAWKCLRTGGADCRRRHPLTARPRMLWDAFPKFAVLAVCWQHFWPCPTPTHGPRPDHI